MKQQKIIVAVNNFPYAGNAYRTYMPYIDGVFGRFITLYYKTLGKYFHSWIGLSVPGNPWGLLGLSLGDSWVCTGTYVYSSTHLGCVASLVNRLTNYRIRISSGKISYGKPTYVNIEGEMKIPDKWIFFENKNETMHFKQKLFENEVGAPLTWFFGKF